MSNIKKLIIHLPLLIPTPHYYTGPYGVSTCPDDNTEDNTQHTLPQAPALAFQHESHVPSSAPPSPTPDRRWRWSQLHEIACNFRGGPSTEWLAVKVTCLLVSCACFHRHSNLQFHDCQCIYKYAIGIYFTPQCFGKAHLTSVNDLLTFTPLQAFSPSLFPVSMSQVLP